MKHLLLLSNVRIDGAHASVHEHSEQTPDHDRIEQHTIALEFARAIVSCAA